MTIEEIMEHGALKMGLETTAENEFDPQPGSVISLLESFENRLSCIDCGEWAASGGPRCEDCEENHLSD